MTCCGLELEDLETSEVEVPAGGIHDIEQLLDLSFSLFTPRTNSGGLHQNI